MRRLMRSAQTSQWRRILSSTVSSLAFFSSAGCFFSLSSLGLAFLSPFFSPAPPSLSAFFSPAPASLDSAAAFLGALLPADTISTGFLVFDSIRALSAPASAVPATTTLFAATSGTTDSTPGKRLIDFLTFCAQPAQCRSIFSTTGCAASGAAAASSPPPSPAFPAPMD
uniref:Uncharacterized protein n=1 Tax=Arundo donax TaxID=35708 RepID=A0A0A9BY90_ARUDO